MAHEKEVTNYHTGEVETVNDNFVQLYVDKLDLIIEMTGENKTAVQVFTWILKHMDKRNALVVSQVALAEVFSITERSIRYAIAFLKQKKALAVLKSGNTNIYAVNAQIAWKADANGKKYALFDAAVYIADSEQDKPLFDTQLVGHAKSRPAKKQRNKAIS
jgi:fatty acid/phospholipid biosynthesis enzyme